jgi:hypothetical protein
VEARLKELKLAYAALKNDIKGQVLQLSFNEKELHLAYDEMAFLKQRIVEMGVS